MTCTQAFVGAMLIAVFSGVASAQETAAAAKKPNQADLEKKFQSALSGATMVGHFTVTGETDGVSPKEERYTLKSVKKLKDNYWLFEARIQYGMHDKTLPLALEVLWAGDTPVITLTNAGIPGFGTFTARVLIYDDQYAGTWSGAGHGGQLFGKIERGEKQDSAKAK